MLLVTSDHGLGDTSSMVEISRAQVDVDSLEGMVGTGVLVCSVQKVEPDRSNVRRAVRSRRNWYSEWVLTSCR